jgi:ElaB/YqjD/DUF883 family membrane-anchored ribosome-binding protein
MASGKTKDTYGYLGTESAALREALERLSAAIEHAARAESAEATKAVSQVARDVLTRATAIVESLPDKAADAKAAMKERRAELEEAIRDKPLLAVGIAALAGFVLAALVRR